jgi:hypothetical protein
MLAELELELELELLLLAEPMLELDGLRELLTVEFGCGIGAAEIAETARFVVVMWGVFCWFRLAVFSLRFPARPGPLGG